MKPKAAKQKTWQLTSNLYSIEHCDLQAPTCLIPMPGGKANTLASLKAKRAETCRIPGARLFLRVGAAAEKLCFLHLTLLVFWTTLKHMALCPSLWQGGLKLVWIMWVCFLSCLPCYRPCHFLFFIFVHCCIFLLFVFNIFNLSVTLESFEIRWRRNLNK